MSALKARSVYPAHGTDALVADRAGNPYEGIIDAVLFFTDSSTLDVYERISISEAGVVRRTQYSYHLRVNGEDVLRADFDPHLPPELRYHRQRPDGSGGWTHEPSARATLTSFIDNECWDFVSAHYEDED